MNVILAIRCSEGPPAVESVKTPCANCGEDCWVSRGTRAGAEGAEVSCIECLKKHLEAAKMIKDIFGGAP